METGTSLGAGVFVVRDEAGVVCVMCDRSVTVAFDDGVDGPKCPDCLIIEACVVCGRLLVVSILDTTDPTCPDCLADAVFDLSRALAAVANPVASVN
jgi:hypothetical protein